MPTNVKSLLTVDQAAELLGVKPLTVRRYIGDSWLASYRIGGRRLIDPTDIVAFIAAGRNEMKARAA
jgi:excisionase family DNA binding protein